VSRGRGGLLGGLRLSRQILLLQASLIVLTVGVGFGVSVYQSRH
jgi:hypothetical protein